MARNDTVQQPAPKLTTRRQFLVSAAATVSGVTIVPRSVLGGPDHVPPSSKINIGFIGVGSQGLRVLLSFLKLPDVQAVAVCDPNKASEDYPQWSKSEFCSAVHRLLGVSAGWEWLSPDPPIRLTPSLTAHGGVAGREPCRQIVDAYNGSRKRSGVARGCAAYHDFRELLDKEKDLDAVVVCTPDHLHGAASVAAMKKGKHVYCQKPMAHSVYAAQRMAEVARATGLATQVAVMNQASEDTRRLAEWIAAGAIGPVREVHNWSSRPFWPQGVDRPQEAQRVPEGLDWDLWLGPAPERPFHHAYEPFVWRGWYDFGCGALGDMGQYSFDTIFRVLGLGAPTRVEASTSERHGETFPTASTVHLDFPARGDKPAVKLTWYDGGNRPRAPEELEGKPLPEEGLLFRGERGAILCGFNGRGPRLVPESRRKSFQQPQATLPRSPGHQREWLDACVGGKRRPGANFEVESAVTLALQLGNVAVRTGQRVEWDPASNKAVNAGALEQYLCPPSRPGWTI
jgi:predicted dehydrogenase